MKQLIKIEFTIFWMLTALMFFSSQIAFGQKCLSFDGNNDVVHVPDDNSLDLTTKGTLEAWIYITSYVNYAGIIHKGDNSGYPMPDEAYTLQFGASGFLGSSNSKLVFAILDNSSYDYVVSATSLNTNTWYHVAAVWNSTDSYMKIYINGMLDAENTSASRTARATSGGLNIGAQLYSPVQYEFNGKIDDVRIWAKSLSQSAIRKKMYKEIDPASNSKLKAYYKFSTGSGSVAYDATANANDGSRSGASWATSTRPVTHLWLGEVSKNWNKASNWFGGWKPNSNIPVEIPSSATYQPTVKSTSKTCEDLTINSGATLTINAGKGLQVYGDLLVDGEIIIKSSSTKTGSLIDNGNISGSGTMKIERYIPKNGWHYVSSPVSSASSNILWGSALYSFNAGSAQWEAHGPNDTLIPMQGYDAYFSSANTTITFSGTFNTGTFSNSLLSSNSNGYNFVGNPYPSYIDWDASTGWTKTNINDAIYIWDATQSNYISYVGGVGTNGGTAFIPPTQGFWITVQSGKTGTLAMTNDVRVHNDSTNFRNSENMEVIRVFLSGNNKTDETAIVLRDRASESFDPNTDAKKMFSDDIAVPQLFSLLSDKTELAINSISYPNEATQIPLSVNIPVAGNYIISIPDSFETNNNVFLEDKELGIITNLNESSYSFYSKQVDHNNRFVLHFFEPKIISNNQNTTTDISEDTEKKSNLSIYSFEHTIYIRSDVNVSAGYIIFDIFGREIKSGVCNGEFTEIDFDNYSGNYIVQYFGKNEIISKKININY